MNKIIKRNPLFFAFFVPAVIDMSLTLVGQDSAYWQGKGIVNEASPAYYFLLASPWIFILGSIVWLTFWYWLLKRGKKMLNIFLMFLFIIAHSWGSSTWISKFLFESGSYQNNQVFYMIIWSVLILYFALIAVFAAYCLNIFMKLEENNRKNLI